MDYKEILMEVLEELMKSQIDYGLCKTKNMLLSLDD